MKGIRVVYSNITYIKLFRMTNLCHPESNICLTDAVLFARNCSTNVKIFAEIWGHFLGPFLVPIFDPDWLSSYNLLHNQNLGSLFGSIFWTSKVTPQFHIYISMNVSNIAQQMWKVTTINAAASEYCTTLCFSLSHHSSGPFPCHQNVGTFSA